MSILLGIIAASFAALAVYLGFQVKNLKETADRMRGSYDVSLRALGSAVQTLSEFSEQEHRTFDSLKGSMLERASSGVAKNAYMRGFEDYRNSYVGAYQTRLRSDLDAYNAAVEAVLPELGYTVEERDGVKTVVKV